MYEVRQIVGGGVLHWYLLAPCGRVVDVAHEDNEREMTWLYRVACFLNISLQHNVIAQAA